MWCCVGTNGDACLCMLSKMLTGKSLFPIRVPGSLSLAVADLRAHFPGRLLRLLVLKLAFKPLPIRNSGAGA